MKIISTLFCLIACVSIASGQYYGSIVYSAPGCSEADIAYYTLFPTRTCGRDASSGTYTKTTCDSVLTEYFNCASDSCSSAECEVVTTPLNQCDSTTSSSVQWKCFSSIPTPAGSYVQYQYDSPNCQSAAVRQITISMSNKCFAPNQGLKTNCTSSSVSFYSCQTGTLVTNLPTGSCMQNDDTSTLLSCTSSTDTPNASPSPSRAPPSASPSSAAPSASPVPVENAAWWGYTQYRATTCSGAHYAYISYARDACVEDELTGSFLKGSCSQDGSSVTIYECDAGCENCALLSTEEVNSCISDYVSSQYTCWNQLPALSTSYVRVDTFPQNTSCAISPVKVLIEPTGCLAGYHTECSDGSVILSQCDSFDCSGTCNLAGATNTSTCALCYGDWYSNTSCHKAGEGDQTSDDTSSAILVYFNLNLFVTAALLLAMFL